MNRKSLWPILALTMFFIVACSGGLPTVPTPESAPGAKFALESFAETYLGITVNPLYAGDATTAVKTLIRQMPPEVQQVLTAPELATQSYWGLLNNGVALVSTGECPTDDLPLCPEPGSIADIELKLRSAALGTYAFRRAGAMPPDAAAAQAMLLEEFPGLADYPFKPVEDAESNGYHFYATDTAIAASEGQPRVAARGMAVGVTQAGGQTIIYAAVALGDLMPALPETP